MGCFGSKDKLSKEDMDFLKSHTRYDETTIKEWYKGFKVIGAPSLLSIDFVHSTLLRKKDSSLWSPCYLAK